VFSWNREVHCGYEDADENEEHPVPPLLDVVGEEKHQQVNQQISQHRGVHGVIQRAESETWSKKGSKETGELQEREHVPDYERVGVDAIPTGSGIGHLTGARDSPCQNRGICENCFGAMCGIEDVSSAAHQLIVNPMTTVARSLNASV
jgi:hypothetical protein